MGACQEKLRNDAQGNSVLSCIVPFISSLLVCVCFFVYARSHIKRLPLM